MEHALQDAEATRRFKISGASSVKDGADTSGASSVTIVELRGELSRARARAEILEERLDETVKCNRRLEREVAQAVEFGVSLGDGAPSVRIRHALYSCHFKRRGEFALALPTVK